MKKYLLLFALLLSAIATQAQIRFESQCDSAKLLIGEQAHLAITVVAGENAQIVFPTFKENGEMQKGIEVVSAKIDTTSASGDAREFKYTLTLTSWTPGTYTLRALPVKVNGKTLQTRSFSLRVDSVTIKQKQLRPAESIMDNPFSWSEWWPLLVLSILALVLLSAAFYVWLRLKDNKPVIRTKRLVKRLAPHERALRAIETLKTQKPEGEEAEKEYYTELTDVLRTYLEERFGIKAKEMTSREILARLAEEQDEGKMAELREVFETADLVKFAKYQTAGNEQNLYLRSVASFISSTKPSGEPAMQEVEEPADDNERHNKRTRRGLRLLMALLIVAAAALIAFVAVEIYTLVS